MLVALITSSHTGVKSNNLIAISWTSALGLGLKGPQISIYLCLYLYLYLEHIPLSKSKGKGIIK